MPINHPKFRIVDPTKVRASVAGAIVDEGVCQYAIENNVTRPQAYRGFVRQELGKDFYLMGGLFGWWSGALNPIDDKRSDSDELKKSLVSTFERVKDIDRVCQSMLSDTVFGVNPEIIVAALIGLELDSEADLLMDEDSIELSYPRAEWMKLAHAAPFVHMQHEHDDSRMLFESDIEYEARATMARLRDRMRATVEKEFEAAGIPFG
ncbi:MAG: hypothetical protein AAGI37_21325 [Planctomycetota bacterium]